MFSQRNRTEFLVCPLGVAALLGQSQTSVEGSGEAEPDRGRREPISLQASRTLYLPRDRAERIPGGGSEGMQSAVLAVLFCFQGGKRPLTGTDCRTLWFLRPTPSLIPELPLCIRSPISPCSRGSEGGTVCREPHNQSSSGPVLTTQCLSSGPRRSGALSPPAWLILACMFGAHSAASRENQPQWLRQTQVHVPSAFHLGQGFRVLLSSVLLALNPPDVAANPRRRRERK